MSLALLRAFTSSGLACTRCGAADVHPLPGAFGPLVGVLGIMRYGCRGCRRSFWIRADAGTRRDTPPPASPEERAAAKATDQAPRAADAALDFEVTATTHERVDLTPLDAEFERIRTGGEAAERPRLEETPGPKPEEAEPPPREPPASPRSRRRRRRKKHGGDGSGS